MRDKNNPVRILITGSRDWHLYDKTGEILMFAIRDAIKDLIVQHDIWFDVQQESVVVVLGGCPTGADTMADWYCGIHGISVERHPADWKTHGKRAGFVRNAEMVNAGADICLAFIKDASPGSSMTLKLAKKNNIPIRVYTN